MGGNAFGFTANRISTEEFNVLERKLSDIFEQHKSSFINVPKVIRSYRSKEGHGDMDLIYTGNPDVVTKILTDNNIAVNVKRNGPATSYLHNLSDDIVFQLDFINEPEQTFDFAYRYFCWNDTGNLIGRLSHRIGLKFGHNGLWYVYRDCDNTRELAKVLLTSDFDTALEYLDLDPTIHSNGFDTVEQIFEYVTSSKYFDYQSVDLSRRNHVSRVRDKKRKTYNQFLQWLKDNSLDCYNLALPPKESFLDQHKQKFPHLAIELEKVNIELAKRNKEKEKFNGAIVSKLTGYEGLILGRFMAYCKEQAWYSDIVELSDTHVRLRILESITMFQHHNE